MGKLRLFAHAPGSHGLGEKMTLFLRVVITALGLSVQTFKGSRSVRSPGILLASFLWKENNWVLWVSIIVICAVAKHLAACL